jgi:hypothetical protein
MERQRQRRRAELCALRFDVATAQAERAVQQVRAERVERRLRLHEQGLTTAEIDERMALETNAVLEVLPMFSEWPLRSAKWGDEWRSEKYSEAMRSMCPVTKAVVWELWRDFGEWPNWYQVSSRISTWLDTDFSDSSAIAGSSKFHIENETGIVIEHPWHLRRENKRHDIATWLWRLDTYEEVLLQERICQWRILLGEDGLRYRTPLAHLLEGLPDRKVPL